MTHQRASRKAFPSLTRDSSIRAPVKPTKPSGDSNEKHRSRSKSKTKVPKSVRYDLENALVGLCDVWFEEIKPYLVRNNIKVHVHQLEAERREAAGDRDCSHLDPGAALDRHRPPCASCVGYCSTHPTASRAPCRKPRAPLPPQLAHCPSMQSPCHNYYETETKPRRRRRRRRVSTSQSSPPQLVPRLCRTYSTQRQTTQEICPRRYLGNKIGPTTNNTTPMKRECQTTYVSKPKAKNKMVQTETLEKVTGSKIKREQKFNSYLKTFERKNATTYLFPVPKKEGNYERGFENLPPLFKDDLIDIIAEKNKQLQILFKSHENNFYPSTMCLLPLNDSRKEPPLKKPWR